MAAARALGACHEARDSSPLSSRKQVPQRRDRDRWIACDNMAASPMLLSATDRENCPMSWIMGLRLFFTSWDAAPSGPASQSLPLACRRKPRSGRNDRRGCLEPTCALFARADHEESSVRHRQPLTLYSQEFLSERYFVPRREKDVVSAGGKVSTKPSYRELGEELVSS